MVFKQQGEKKGVQKTIQSLPVQNLEKTAKKKHESEVGK